MFLSRSGIDLSKLAFQQQNNLEESVDRSLQRLKRQARSGDPEARANWARNLERSGQGMSYHLDNYVDATREHNQAPSPRDGEEMPIAEIKRRKRRAALRKVQDHATDTGEVASHYLTMDHVRRMGNTYGRGKNFTPGRREHIGAMADLHNGYPGRLSAGSITYALPDEQSAEHLRSAIEKHYPELKPRAVTNFPSKGQHMVQYDSSDD